MNHQDKDVIIRGKNPVITNDMKVNIVKPKGFSEAISKKLDSDEPPPPDKTTHKMAQEITKARIALGLNRKQIANKLNMTEGVYSVYENAGNPIIKKELVQIKNFLKIADFTK